MKTLAETSVVSRNTVCFVCLFILFCFVLFVCLFVFLKGLRSFRLCILFYQAMLCLVFYTSVFEIMIVVYSLLFFKKKKKRNLKLWEVVTFKVHLVFATSFHSLYFFLMLPIVFDEDAVPIAAVAVAVAATAVKCLTFACCGK